MVLIVQPIGSRDELWVVQDPFRGVHGDAGHVVGNEKVDPFPLSSGSEEFSKLTTQREVVDIVVAMFLGWMFGVEVVTADSGAELLPKLRLSGHEQDVTTVLCLV